MTFARVAALAVVVAACGKPASGPTYYADVKPIVDARCTKCHVAGGIAPFALGTYAELVAKKDKLHDAVRDRIMPPWMPDDHCNSYLGDRTLTDDQRSLIVRWVESGALVGEPSQAGQPLAQAPSPSLSRVDATLAMATPYVPRESPDEYRCFLLDWPATTTKFITGFSAKPGNPAVVHHVIAYLIAPADVASYQALDGADGHPGYSCFGGPGGPSDNINFLGGWTPGTDGLDFPAGTGLRVDAGSKLVLQLHYNTAAVTGTPAPDRTSLQLKLDDHVEKEAAFVPWVNPRWLNHKMPIPAGAADVVHSFALDITPFAADYTNGTIASNEPFTVYTARLHMHTRGSHGRLDILRASGEDTCLLEIPRWDFHWQADYELAKPVVFQPGDQLSIECHWDNSAAHQPLVDGKPVAPTDLNWGERTEDEMCIGFFYVSQ